jgi:hypothetical protein
MRIPSSAFTTIWQRLQQEAGIEIPADVQRQVESEWSRDAQLRGRHQGIFAPYARRRAPEIMGSRGGTKRPPAPAAPAPATSPRETRPPVHDTPGRAGAEAVSDREEVPRPMLTLRIIDAIEKASEQELAEIVERATAKHKEKKAGRLRDELAEARARVDLLTAEIGELGEPLGSGVRRAMGENGDEEKPAKSAAEPPRRGKPEPKRSAGRHPRRFRTVPEDMGAAIVTMTAQGRSQAEIMERFDLSRSTVKRYQQRHAAEIEAARKQRPAGPETDGNGDPEA